jgi:hypothetical protein
VKEKYKTTPNLSQRILYRLAVLFWGIIIFILAGFLLCSCSLFWLVAHNIVGEAITHYPNSRLIWAGRNNPYGSGDYGTRVYYRWTDDSPEVVEAYYAHLPEQWQASVRLVEDIDIDSEWVCTPTIGGFFRRIDPYDFDSPQYSEGCETLKAKLPSYGTLITFSHSQFVG